MSRGLGRIERSILERIAKDRTSDGGHAAHVSSAQLFFDCYPEMRNPTGWGWQEPAAAQRQAIWRAMHAIVRKYPQYALMGGKGRGPLWLYEPGDAESTLWTELSVQYGFVSRSDVRAVAEGSQPTYALSQRRNRRSAGRTAWVVGKMDPMSASALAAKARALVGENDPDAIRDGLTEIAKALDVIAQAVPQ